MKYLIYILGIIIALVSRLKTTRKFHTAMEICLLVIIVYLTADFSLINKDNIQYRYYYMQCKQGILYSGFENGYLFISSILAKMNFSYLSFRYIYLSIFSCLLFFVVRRFTTNLGTFYVFYFLYGMFRDAEQIRFFAASAILYVGMYILATKDGRKRALVFTGIVFLAAQFHQTAYFFIFMLILTLPKVMYKKILKLMLIFSTALFAFVLVDRKLFVSLIYLIDKGRADFYTEVNAHYGFLFPFALFAINMMIIVYVQNKIAGKGYKTTGYRYHISHMKIFKRYTTLDVDRMLDLSYLSVVLSLYTVPLLAINTHFYRLGRCVMIFSLILLSEYLNHLCKNDRLIIKIMISIMLIGYFVFDFFMTGSVSQQVLPLWMD